MMLGVGWGGSVMGVVLFLSFVVLCRIVQLYFSGLSPFSWLKIFENLIENLMSSTCSLAPFVAQEKG